jgi:hypothetical protein
MQQDFKDLLAEVERLRQQVSDRDSHIQTMVSEMHALPTLQEAKATSKLIDKYKLELD